jgi:beta-carotene hydroxylase
VVATSSMPLFARASLIIPLVFFASHGLHLLGWVGHEGLHLSLHRNKFVSVFAGIFFSSLIVGFFEIGSAVPHWTHHRYTNQLQDPDCEVFVKFKSFWSRLLFARMAVNRTYLINTFKMAFNLPLSYACKLPFSPNLVRLMAWTNIFCSLFWIVVYVIIISNNPITGIVSIFLPHILIIHTGLRSYIEHAGTQVGVFHDSRTRTSLISTILYFFNNYHLEHHLYPSVPCYNLRSVHNYLKHKGFYQQTNSPIETNPFKAFLFTTSLFMYPDAIAYDASYDPLVTEEIETLA